MAGHPQIPAWAGVPIAFTPEDGHGRLFPHNDTMVITVRVEEADVHCVLVDRGSSTDILFVFAFDQMWIPRSRLTRAKRPLKGFNGDLVEALGQIELPVCFGRGTEAHTGINFDVVDLPYTYNVIMGRGTLNKFGAAVDQNYLCMKIPGPSGVIMIHGD
ncbi:hypothetical protein E2562_034962 [Oryza meyeriana var. granulata]|uniref:Xylanase inhibitor C-terminal domain-containing protein n=1 Tax=Oryza meyeriana var. granulata TaxID=110450 RepID=A0A6G1BQC8_9ORYZ|nr:hypothetical protein E2562_034962 [Oryza meyeriana var. granulata]